MATVQWYQSSNTVTASIGLKGIPPDCSGDISARFGEQYCAVYVGDSVYWERHLVGRIVPERCKLSVGKVRAELKLKKADPQQWSEFEAEPPPNKNPAENGKSLPPADAPPVTSLPPTSLPAASPTLPPTSLPAASLPPTSLHAASLPPTFPPAASLPPTSLHAGSLPERPFLLEDLTFLNHLPHDWFEMGGCVVMVKVMVRGVDERTCKVAFCDRTLEIRFQTCDQKFLKTCSGSCPTDTFTWGIQLFDSIVPAESSFSVKPMFVELRLRKAGSLRWKALERHQRSLGITSNHLDCIPLTNQMQEHNQQLSNQNTGDVMLNDMDIDTDPPHSKSHTSNFESGGDVAMTVPQARDALISTTVAMLRGGSPSSSAPSHTPTHGSSYPARYSPTTSKLSHSHIPPAAMETTDPSYRYTQLRRPSMTGLCNTGNTCFMNSIVQCLSNTKGLRDYFIEGHYLADINKVNPLGFKGELAKCFSMIIRKLWSGEYEYFSAVKLKEVIVSRSSSFSGHQQHDSHEFMSYLLDGLHEDLNRVCDKPLTKPVEMEDCPDVEVAEKSWNVHKQRNDSYFVDHFQGQFKSTLVCPDCSKVSTTFDPFMSLSVPIPKNLRHLPIIFVPKDPDLMPRQYILKLPPEARLELLKASVARKMGIPMTHLRVFEAYSGKFQTLLSSNLQPIKSIGDKDIIIISEVLSRQEAHGKVVEFNVIQRVELPLFPTKCSVCSQVTKEGIKLLRCGKCKAVGYCNRTCQSRDWSEHRLKCRRGRPVPVGLPFVVSLAASQLTYAKLASMVEKIARRSVKIEQKDILLKKPLGTNESTGGTQGSMEGAQRSAEEEQRTMYTLTPVDRYGDSVEGATPLEDRGDEVLIIGSKFLAMDWKNNPKEGGCLTITPKPMMDYQKDPTTTTSSHSAGGPITLEQCLEHLTEPETLSQEEAWYCPHCKKHREATKQMLVWRLPHVLIIHLKRFSFVNYTWRDKINEMVSFPLRGLDMSPYMLEAAVQSDNPQIYDLYATVNHYGIVWGGHYSASVKPPTAMETGAKDWLCYDDDKVVKLPDSKVVSKYTYILFYCRRDYLQTKP